MLFLVKWDATGITDDSNLVEQCLSREAAAALTAKLRAKGALPDGVHAIYGAEVDEDSRDGDDYKVFAKVELVVEAEDPAGAAGVGTDAFLVGVVSAMIDEDAHGAYELGGFVVLDIEVYVDEPDVDLAEALAG